SNYEFIELLIKVIEKQPTAYDVDKVVDILTSKGIDRIRKSTSPFDNFAGMAVAYKDAVAVVKDGWNDCIDAIGGN
ncbi:MAG: hypothetical protein PHY47_28580, partial [Lachnospiraceae bacterium]|nr:hypothetical protein [Lachnospiraceae bacterium]